MFQAEVRYELETKQKNNRRLIFRKADCTLTSTYVHFCLCWIRTQSIITLERNFLVADLVYMAQVMKIFDIRHTFPIIYTDHK